MATKLYLSIAQAARRLDVCDETIRRWIRAGKIDAIRYPSGQIRVSVQVVEKILATPVNISRQTPHADR